MSDITSHVHRTPAVYQSGVNFSNLISITTQNIHESTHQSKSSINVLWCFNSQYAARKPHIFMIVNTDVDVLMLTKTW